jgi:hypothetical protein
MTHCTPINHIEQISLPGMNRRIRYIDTTFSLFLITSHQDVTYLVMVSLRKCLEGISRLLIEAIIIFLGLVFVMEKMKV